MVSPLRVGAISGLADLLVLGESDDSGKEVEDIGMCG